TTRLGRVLAVSALVQLGSRSGPVRRRRAGALRLRVPQAAIPLAIECPGRLRHRGRPVPGRAPGRFLSGQLTGTHVRAAPRLGYRGGALLRLRERDPTRRRRPVLPGAAAAVRGYALPGDSHRRRWLPDGGT